MIWLGEVLSFRKMISLTPLKNFNVLICEKELYKIEI